MHIKMRIYHSICTYTCIYIYANVNTVRYVQIHVYDPLLPNIHISFPVSSSLTLLSAETQVPNEEEDPFAHDLVIIH